MKKLLLICSILLSFESNAGMKSLTWHSRANCVGFNESVTWELRKSWDLETSSSHSGQNHPDWHWVTDDKRNTWRSIGYHFPEGNQNGWHVLGSHIVFNGPKRTYYTTEADDCNIYDGWWDQN